MISQPFIGAFLIYFFIFFSFYKEFSFLCYLKETWYWWIFGQFGTIQERFAVCGKNNKNLLSSRSEFKVCVWWLVAFIELGCDNDHYQYYRISLGIYYNYNSLLMCRTLIGLARILQFLQGNQFHLAGYLFDCHSAKLCQANIQPPLAR